MRAGERFLHDAGSYSDRAAGGYLIRAILRRKFGGSEVLVIREPEPKAGHALISAAFNLDWALAGRSD